MANLPNSGITISMVAETLGTTSRDLGTLCKHENVNMYSQNKPVNYVTTSPITDAQRKEVNYGLSINSANTALNMILLVNASNGIGVEYEKPRGDFRGPCRLGDFRNYKHDAKEPVTAWFKANTSAYTSNDWDSIQPYYLSSLDGDGQLTVNDIYRVQDENGNQITNLNYGIAIVSAATTAVTVNTVKWSVGGIPWNNGQWNNFRNKWCYTYEFLTNLASGTTSDVHHADTTDCFLPLPKCKHRVYFIGTNTGTTGSTSYEFKIGARFETKGNTSVTGTVTVSSVDTTSKVYTGGTITMMRAELLTSSTATSHVGYTYLVMDGGNQVIGTEQSRQFVCTLSPTNSSVTLRSCKVKLYWKTVANPTVQSQIYSIMIGVGDLEIIT